MYIKFKNKIDIILGRLNVSQKSLKIFDNRVIDFLDEISIEIKRSKSARTFSDLQAFGFWCRKANINRLSKNYTRNELNAPVDNPIDENPNLAKCPLVTFFG